MARRAQTQIIDDLSDNHWVISSHPAQLTPESRFFEIKNRL